MKANKTYTIKITNEDLWAALEGMCQKYGYTEEEMIEYLVMQELLLDVNYRPVEIEESINRLRKTVNDLKSRTFSTALKVDFPEFRKYLTENIIPSAPYITPSC